MITVADILAVFPGAKVVAEYLRPRPTPAPRPKKQKRADQPDLFVVKGGKR